MASGLDRLPPEIWFQIFSNLADADPPAIPKKLWMRPKSGTILSIIQVCSAWRHFAEPLLYRKIRLDYRDDDFIGAVSKLLHKSLATCPSRYAAVHYVYLGYTSNFRCNDILNAVEAMTSLRHINLRHFTHRNGEGHIDGADPVLNSVGSLLAVQTLETCPATTEYLLRRLSSTDSIFFPSLVEWTLYGFAHFSHTVSLPPSRDRKSCLKCIRFPARWDFKLLVELLKWPRALQKLEVRSRYHSVRRMSPYSARDIQSSLNDHSPSIQYLALPDLPGTSPYNFLDLTNFTSLTYLELGFRHLRPIDPKAAVENICPRSLRTLCIGMEIHHFDAGYSVFQEKCAQWVWELVFNYRHMSSKGSLERIHVEFRWTYQLPLYETDFTDFWPNSFLAALEPHLSAQTINLTWPKPKETEEDWYRARYKDDPEAWNAKIQLEPNESGNLHVVWSDFHRQRLQRIDDAEQATTHNL